MMASLVVAIVYYQLGHAPPQEPISGYFADSWMEPIFLALLWGLIAVGALLSTDRHCEGESKSGNRSLLCLERRRRAARLL